MLRNLSGGGFLAEASASLPIGSVHTIKLSGHDGLVAIVTARCAHCRPLVPSVVPRFAMGFAFVAARAGEIEALLDQLMPDVAFP
jgi:hypothetical protein